MLEKCFECGNPAEHQHHVIPKSYGGTKTLPLCRNCHNRVHKGEVRIDTFSHLTQNGKVLNNKTKDNISNKKNYRSDDIIDHAFDQKTLVGSFFHGCAERSWQGYVVAEPHPGVYLVETFSWIHGGSTHQHLIRIETMIEEEWLFYDNVDWMKSSYDNDLSYRWDRERESAGENSRPGA